MFLFEVPIVLSHWLASWWVARPFIARIHARRAQRRLDHVHEQAEEILAKIGILHNQNLLLFVANESRAQMTTNVADIERCIAAWRRNNKASNCNDAARLATALLALKHVVFNANTIKDIYGSDSLRSMCNGTWSPPLHNWNCNPNLFS